MDQSIKKISNIKTVINDGLKFVGNYFNKTKYILWNTHGSSIICAKLKCYLICGSKYYTS